MPAFMTLYDESTDPANRDFYAPSFELRIDGVGLPQGVLRDVMQVTYHDDVNEIDGFELTVNNWDATARCCKYIGSETAAQLNGDSNASKLFTLFDPGGKTARLGLGYIGNLMTMVHASFTTVEPNFPESGPPVLTVRGLNILQQLRKKKFTQSWTGQTPSAIAVNFNSLRDAGQPRLASPWTVVTNQQAASAETVIDYVTQKDQYDVDFLLQLAHSQGYALEADETLQQIYFGPTQTSVATNYQLEWGKGLMSFKPSLSTTNQWQSVTVRGWDRQSQKVIKETVDLNDPQIKRINTNLHNLIQDRQQQTVDLPVFTAAEAKQKARALLMDRSAQIVTAHGKTVGLPALRAGTLVNIQGIGARLSGTYFVTKSTHTLGDNGYVTEFDCRREDLAAGETDMRDRIPGIVTGKVVSVSDPQNQGRVQVSFPWLDDTLKSTWASIVAPFAGDNRGTYFMPELNDEVVVGFEHGDFDHAFVLGATWNGTAAPPSTDPRQRIIRSKNGHTIRFVDSTPSGGNMGALTVEDAHGNRVVMTNGVMRITGQVTLMIEADMIVLSGKPVNGTAPWSRLVTPSNNPI